MKKKNISEERFCKVLEFETFSYEKIGKGHYRLYATVKNDNGYALVQSDLCEGCYSSTQFSDRHVIPFEIEQAEAYFKQKIKSLLLKLQNKKIVNEVVGYLNKPH